MTRPSNRDQELFHTFHKKAVFRCAAVRKYRSDMAVSDIDRCIPIWCNMVAITELILDFSPHVPDALIHVIDGCGACVS